MRLLLLLHCIVRLFGQGLDVVEVSDDGTGVPPESRALLATRYATSKIRSVEELYSGSECQTMGFRGEALFSLACLSQKLVVATRTADEPMATRLHYLRNGCLDPTSVTHMARKIGTTVAVVGLFDALPARRADMARRIRAERQNVFRMLEACK
jgi:DNA mismatch repair protein PMS2